MELSAHAWHHMYGLDICCLRFFTVYGPRQRPDLAIRLFAQAARTGASVVQYGDGSSARDYTFVTDTVEGIARAMERSRGWQVVNLGCGQTVQLSQLIREVERVSGQQLTVEQRPPRTVDAPLTHSDNHRADAVLGFWPRVPFDEGMERFWRWFEELA
jgi:UDP-glucuronate 4-epimerase